MDDGKRNFIPKMNQMLRHRGPDNEGYFTDSSVAIGHQRLSIIDTSASSNQPMTSDDNAIVLAYNGEIYNYKHLKKSLNYPFKSSGDTEVIIALYKKHGPEFIHMLDGMFSFCLYDKTKNKILLARDKMGQKPLYYYKGSGYLLVSSEIRPLLKTPYFKAVVDQDSLQQYLFYKTVYAPKTIIKGVRSFKAANFYYLSIPAIFESTDQNELDSISYWNYADNIEESKGSELLHSQRKIKELFTQAVEKRLMSDVNLGVFLSGGVDSTAITGVASSLKESRLDTFSIDFKEDGYSEENYVKSVSTHFNTNHQTLEVDRSFFMEHFMDGLNSLDHPSEDGLNTFFISQFAKQKGVSVSLSGIGGDELFGGYYTFDVLTKIKQAQWYWKLPSFMKTLILAYRSKNKPGVITNVLNGLKQKDRFMLEEAYPFLRLSNEKTYFESSNHTNNYQLDKPFLFDSTHFLSNLSQYELNFYMQNILLRDADCMSMASSLEVRAPFLDSSLIAYSLSLPDHLKGRNKELFKNALSDYIPEEIKNRSKKGFVIPYQKWLNNDFFTWTNKHVKALFDRSEIGLDRTLFGDFVQDNNYYDSYWHLAVLEYWLQKNVDVNE